MPLAPSCNDISDNTSVGFRVWHKPLDSLNHNKLTLVSAGSGGRSFALCLAQALCAEWGQLSCARGFIISCPILFPSSVHPALSVGRRTKLRQEGVIDIMHLQRGNCCLTCVLALFVKPSSKPKRSGNMFLNCIKKKSKQSLILSSRVCSSVTD